MVLILFSKTSIISFRKDDWVRAMLQCCSSCSMFLVSSSGQYLSIVAQCKRIIQLLTLLL